MPVICIGPVCVPITAILPILLFLFRPIYNRLSPENQKKCDRFFKDCELGMNRFLKKIGWPWFTFGKKKNNDNNNNGNKKNNDGNIVCDGDTCRFVGDCDTSNENENDKTDDGPLFYQLTDNDDWDDIVSDASCKDKPIFAYFTADWCKPCQKLYPTLCSLADKNDPQFGKFVKVNVDTCDEIAIECGGTILPTYQVYLNGEKVESLTGANEDKLRQLFDKKYQ